MKRYFSEKSPNIHWKLNENLGNRFEDLITNLMIEQLKKYHPNVIVHQTQRSADGGKDIVVISKKDNLNILGQKFILNGKNEIKIFFECKSTDDSVLSYDKVCSSFTRAKHQNIDYYVLVTNSTILPQAFWLIEDDLSASHIAFKLIDSFLLGTFIADFASPNSNKTIKNPYDKSSKADFYFEYQVDSFKEQLTNKYDIYMLLRNYSSNNKLCKLRLMTDVNWSIDIDEISLAIEPNGFAIKKITVQQNHFDGVPDLLFKVQVNGTESDIMINGIDGDIVFDPPFFGESRKLLINSLSNQIKTGDTPSVICFWGEAGIGKTRLVEELMLKLNGTLFDFFECKSTSGQRSEQKIIRFLNTKNYIRSDETGDFSTIINNCHNEYRHAIIFIDDLHNSSSEFFEQIKKIKPALTDVTLIICGRTDFDMGNVDYLSFIKWTKEKIKHCYEIDGLKDSETKNMIKAMVNGVPEYALNRLHRLSMNNPLFIVQFIEYMLDVRIVKLINRNTVGIIDINRFHEKEFIPKKIEHIYKRRIENLLNAPDGINLLNFLYKLALCNGKFQRVECYKYFDCNYDYIDKLKEHRFIQNGKYISFFHESFFLYIKKRIENARKLRKSLASDILGKYDIEKKLNNFLLGRLCVYANKNETATNYFENIISWIDRIDNISNLNVNLDYYDYLFDIFELSRQNFSFYEIAKKALIARVYITLHHFAPINAANECDIAISLINKYNLSNDKRTLLSILELKAHALMNAGLYANGEALLKEIQVNWILDKKILDNKTLFDMYDRLSSVYRHFNLKELAIKYNELSRVLADDLNDAHLQMLSNRTKYKIHLYLDRNIAEESLKETNDLNKITPLQRIKTDNDLDLCGLKILNNNSNNNDQIIEEIKLLHNYSDKQGFNRAKIHSYFLLAVCYLLKGDENSITTAGQYVEEAINLSATFGIVGYMWRLYNLDAIIKTRLNADFQVIHKTFNTVFDILRNRGLLYIGNCDLTHGNILAISNYGFHLQEQRFESFFYEKMSLITFNMQNRLLCKIAKNDAHPLSEYLVQQYQRAKNKMVLFVESQPKLLRDSETGYIIIL
ncbi:MAG: AAA family ATPase [Clostridiales bacterium]|nr:AAA family ATPase [Clostridiales bacterium]